MQEMEGLSFDNGTKIRENNYFKRILEETRLIILIYCR